MKAILLFIGSIVILNGSVKAQQIATDSIDLGEDITSHNYQQFGSVALGSYTCGDDSTIRVGNGNSGDSITFELAVTPGSDSVKLEMAMPWSGGNKTPLLWIENYLSDTIPFLGASSCDLMHINFSGLSAFTSDGSVKIKIMDTLGSFSMDGQITHIKIYSDTVSSVGISEKNQSKNDFTVYPNPSNGIFTIETKGFESNHFELFDLYGRRTGYGQLQLTKTKIDLSSFSKGIYLLRIEGINKKIIVE